MILLLILFHVFLTLFLTDMSYYVFWLKNMPCLIIKRVYQKKEKLHFKGHTSSLIHPPSIYLLSVYYVSCNVIGDGEKDRQSPCAKGTYMLLEEDRY